MFVIINIAVCHVSKEFNHVQRFKRNMKTCLDVDGLHGGQHFGCYPYCMTVTYTFIFSQFNTVTDTVPVTTWDSHRLN